MAKKTKNKVNPSGVLLYAKKSGLTSFSSLWSIKHALNTEKVGHTGTLDSFADGLLVVLSGNLTHLVPHITGFSKTYQALVCFGKETDTLDPTGQLLRTGKVVSREDVESACLAFRGALLQTPPAYSAVHVNGKRASDVVRSGKSVEIEPRQIFIYKNELLDFMTDEASGVSYAIIEVKCSKGTYIRALARDMAHYLGTCAYLSALRRTSVGPFKLEDAVAYNDIEPFTIESGRKKESLIRDNLSVRKDDTEELFDDIRSHFMTFTPELASKCGFVVDQIPREYEASYLTGRPLNGKMFRQVSVPDVTSSAEYCFTDEIAVYYEDQSFAGMIQKKDNRLSYGFVVPHIKERQLKVFSWEQIARGAFPLQWKEKGCALTVGSFDGMHAGHNALIESVLRQKNLIKGIVTFRSSYRASESGFEGDVISLHQKLGFCTEKGLDFAIVIDFSSSFGKMEGYDFIQSLLTLCNMKYLAEGVDFTCGYKGLLNVGLLSDFAKEKDFVLEVVDDVLFEGQRVSSSRIRHAIKEGWFSKVQKMLLRPYAYDSCKISWNKVSDGLFEAVGVSEQILPKAGNYSVVVYFKGDTTLKTTCVVGETLKLLLPGYDKVDGLESLSFIP